MALALISVTIQDADGDESTALMYGDTGVLTLANLIEVAQDYATSVDGITDGKIVDLNLTIKPDLPAGLQASAVAYSETQKGALFSFNLNGTSYTDSIRIPAFTESYFVGDNVDTTIGAVSSFLNNMLTGFVTAGGTFTPSNRYGFDIVSLAKAVKSFRKR